MTWFRVDDDFADHPKVRSIPRKDRPAVIGLWTMAGTWCARHLTDGEVPGYMLDEFGTPERLARALINAGLWHGHGHACPSDGCRPIPAGSFLFHEWSPLQPTREEELAKRAKARDRMARNRARSHDVRANDASTSHTVTPTPARPVPARPDPSSTGTHLGGEGDSPSAPASPRPHCRRHPNGPDHDEPCRQCAKVRAWEETRPAADLETARAARAAAVAACTACDETGMTTADPDHPKRCTHPRSATA